VENEEFILVLFGFLFALWMFNFPTKSSPETFSK